MRIQPIQQHSNYTCKNRQKPSFKGEFIRNEAIDTLMSCSDIGGLKRFKELVQNIKKVNDDSIFWVELVEWEYDINNGSDTAYDYDYYLHTQKGQDKKTDKKLVTIYDKVPYESKLSKVNEGLEKFYGNKIQDKNKGNLIKEIDELLIKK